MTKILINTKRAVNKSGRIVILAEKMEATANTEIAIFNPSATLSETGPCFFIIYSNLAPGKYSPVYKSEIKRPTSGVCAWN